MRLAMVVTSLFPTGGLQRDCLAISRILAGRGHAVTVITSDYRQPVDLEGLTLEVWRSRALTKAGRIRQVAARLAAERGRFDRIVGFNKIPGVDIYYCADPPAAETRPARLLPWLGSDGRRRIEKDVFAPEAPTAILVLAEHQVAAYRAAWNTPETRFHLVPPTLAPARRQPDLRLTGRHAARATLGLGENTSVWLAVASAPRTKGTDRVVESLAGHPDAVLLVAGIYPGSREARRLLDEAARAGIADRIRLLGYREDMPAVMAAADLLVHPARRETTGTAILESIANGLPAIVTGLCGYAPHVLRGEAGIVLPEPFRQSDLTAALATARDPDLRARWSRNGIAYGADPGLSTGLSVAADRIAGPLWR